MVEVVKRAGDVVGTPAWQLDLMYEDEAARAWETENQHMDAMDRVDMQKLLEASCHLKTAKEADLDFALEWISKAAELLEGTPEADKLNSLYDQVSDIVVELMRIEKKAHEKWRERW